MGATGLLVCVCQGTCPSFKSMDIFEVMTAVRREKLVDFAALHPQLCADDGDTFLKILLGEGKVDKIYIAACDPGMQKKMFRSAFEDAGFDPKHHFAVDIRNMSTEDAVATIRNLIVTDKG